MGCQCTKSNEISNMNLETVPPKIELEINTKVNNDEIIKVKY